MRRGVVEARTIGASISEFRNKFWVRSFVVVGGFLLLLLLLLVMVVVVVVVVEDSSPSFMMLFLVCANFLSRRIRM